LVPHPWQAVLVSGKHYQDTAVVQAATNMPEHHHTQHQVFVHPHFTKMLV